MMSIALLSGYTEPSGDSYNHFLISHYAFRHPHLLLDHWGKPVFTLLTSAIYRLGYGFMPVFNILVTALSALLIGHFAFRQFSVREAVFSIIAFYASPQVFYHQFSAFTEPLFGLFLLGMVLLVIKSKFVPAALLCSILPFVRSEGFIVLLTFTLYLVLRGKFRQIPWLAFGFVVYAIAGLFVFGDFFWFFTQNPYAGNAAHYGSGTWLHFFENYGAVCGYPLMALLVVGLLFRWWIWLKLLHKGSWKEVQESPYFFIHALFFCYFLSHVVFWKFGIFRSFGLLRVMTAIAGLGVLISTDGLCFIAALFRSRTEWVPIFFGLLVAVWPFTENNTGFQLKQNFRVKDDIAEIQKLKSSFDVLNHDAALVYFSHPALPVYWGFDPFDTNKARPLDHVHHLELPAGSLVVWDSWYAAFEHHVDAKMFSDTRKFEPVISQGLSENENSAFRIYRVIGSAKPSLN